MPLSPTASPSTAAALHQSHRSGRTWSPPSPSPTSSPPSSAASTVTLDSEHDWTLLSREQCAVVFPSTVCGCDGEELPAPDAGGGTGTAGARVERLRRWLRGDGGAGAGAEQEKEKEKEQEGLGHDVVTDGAAPVESPVAFWHGDGSGGLFGLQRKQAKGQLLHAPMQGKEVRKTGQTALEEMNEGIEDLLAWMQLRSLCEDKEAVPLPGVEVDCVDELGGDEDDEDVDGDLPIVDTHLRSGQTDRHASWVVGDVRWRVLVGDEVGRADE